MDVSELAGRYRAYEAASPREDSEPGERTRAPLPWLLARNQGRVIRHHRYSFVLSLVFTAATFTLFSGSAWSVPPGSSTRAAQAASGPELNKLDPPNWWTGFTGEVEVLAAGRNLNGATVACSYPGVSFSHSKVTDGGRYLFIWLNIEPNAIPGNAVLRVTTPAGEASVSFPLQQRGPTAGKFQGFSEDDVLYLIMPDRFADGDGSNDQPADAPGSFDRAKPRAYHGGDLQGIRDHLNYLRSLGVTTIWLTPIVQNDPASPQDYHGYGAADEYKVEEHFGTMKDLQALVRDAHARNLKVILDFVPNHIGPHHPWAADPPEPDWFNGTLAHHSTSNGNFRFLTDPHVPPRYWRDVVDGWFAGILPDLDQDNPDVAQYLIENALWWAEETGIDGYRLDTFPYVSRQFWSEWHEALHAEYPQMTTVGEVFNPNPDITSYFVGGRKGFDGIDTGVTTVFDFPLFFALRGVLSGRASMQTIVDVLSRDRLYPHPELLVPFVGNHDVPRLASLPGMSQPRLQLAYSLLLTMRGIPEIYYGDEIGMTGAGDPDNRHDFPGGFPSDPRDAFTESGRAPQQQGLFAHVQRLLALRRDHDALRRGQLWNIFWNKTAYAFARTSADERILVAANAGPATQKLDMSFADTPLSGATRLSSFFDGSNETVTGDRIELLIPANRAEIYLVK